MLSIVFERTAIAAVGKSIEADEKTGGWGLTSTETSYHLLGTAAKEKEAIHGFYACVTRPLASQVSNAVCKMLIESQAQFAKYYGQVSSAV